MNSNSAPLEFGNRHYAVIGVGLLVFVLLFFADKTNLKTGRSDAAETGMAPAAPAGKESGLLSEIPPLGTSAAWDSLKKAIGKAADDSSRVQAYRSAVEYLSGEGGRLDAAAVYAGKLADLSPGFRNLLVAGALFRNAAALPGIVSDSVKFRKFSARSIRHLEQAVELQPQNEGALIELGLAYIESGRGELSMQGILKLREVTELNPDNAEAAFHLGMFSRQTGQLEKAAERFETVIRVQPDNALARFQLAATRLDLGQKEEARRLFGELAKMENEPGLSERAKEILKKI